MAKYYRLAIDSIESVQNIVKGPRKTPLQLNDGQCKILAQELAELSVYLQGISDKFTAHQGVWEIALLHLYSAIKKAELLVEKCCCENLESWLLAAMTLVEIQEDFVANILDLHQWRRILDIAIASARRASRDKIKELLMNMDVECQELFEKLRHALQQAAVEDKKKILLKLSQVQESENDLNYLRASHLQSWLTQSEDETQVVEYQNPPFLGRGGCATVLQVKWLGVHCALKILDIKDKREATALKGLLHPNIIRLYRYWEAPSHNPKSNLLMELMAMDLSAYIESRLKDMASSSTQQIGARDTMPFSLPVAIDLMLQVAQAMKYLHDRHLAHRDLKTSNILVRRVSESLTQFYGEGYLDIKLADFGLAKAYDKSSTGCNYTPNTGTPVYGAPEIFGKELATQRNFPPKADVWSFGVTCSEILSGKKPFVFMPRITPEELHRRIAEENLRPTLPNHCPQYLAFCIRSCWEFQPQRRPDFANICRMLRHAKLLSLNITTLNDARPCMTYSTYTGFGSRKSFPKASVPSRLLMFFQTSFLFLSNSTTSKVPEIPNEKVEKHELEENHEEEKDVEEEQHHNILMLENELHAERLLERNNAANSGGSSLSNHSADAQLKQELAAVFKKIGDKQTCTIGLYELYRITQLYPQVDIFSQLQNASEAFRTYISDGIAQMERNAAAGRTFGSIPVATPPPVSSPTVSHTKSSTSFQHRGRGQGFGVESGSSQGLHAFEDNNRSAYTDAKSTENTEAFILKSSAGHNVMTGAQGSGDSKPHIGTISGSFDATRERMHSVIAETTGTIGSPFPNFSSNGTRSHFRRSVTGKLEDMTFSDSS